MLKILIIVRMQFIAPKAGQYFARIAEPETTMNIGNLAEQSLQI